MERRCTVCGKPFQPREEWHRTCPDCFSRQRPQRSPGDQRRDEPVPLLSGYYDSEGNLLKAVFIGEPEAIAKQWSGQRMKMKQLRTFHSRILKIRAMALRKPFASVRPLLYECIKDAEYQYKREFVPRSFLNFLKHHISLAEKNVENLEGFFKHLDSIVSYFPTDRT